MKVTLVHNPTAGDGRHSGDDLLAMLHQAGHDAVYQSTKADHYAQALENPGDLVIVAGGDGTVGKVAMHLVGRGIPMAVFPLGTANNISKTLGIHGAPRQLVARLTSAGRKNFNVGVAIGPCGETRFLEAVGVGLFARVMSALESKGKDNPINDPDDRLSRDLLALQTVLADYRPHNLHITLDGEDFSGQYLLVEAMNIKSVGPNLFLSPGADPGDGYLDVVLVSEGEREKVAAYLTGRLQRDDPPLDLTVRKGQQVRVEWEGSEIHIDDEVWPEGDMGSPAVFDISLQSQVLEFLTYE